jgi:hypothetical protein
MHAFLGSWNRQEAFLGEVPVELHRISAKDVASTNEYGLS